MLPLMTTVLGAGFITGIIPSGILPANIPNIEDAYNLSHAEMGRIVGNALIFGGAAGGLLGGWICGMLGALRVLLFSLGLAVVSLLTVGLVHNLQATVLGLTGYFMAAALMGSSNALAAKMLPDIQRGVTLLHAANAVGKLTGPILASIFLYSAWRNSFNMIAGMVVLLAIPAILSGKHRHASAGLKNEGSVRAGFAFFAAVSGFGLIAGSELAVVMWLPTYAREVRGFSAGSANLLLSIFLLGLVFGRFAASGLSHRISSTQAIVICGSTVVFVVPALHSGSYVISAIFFLLFGLAYSATWPSYFAYLARVSPDHLGALTGGAVFWNHVGLAVFACISGRLADINEATPLFFGAAVMGGFALIFSIIARLKGAFHE